MDFAAYLGTWFISIPKKLVWGFLPVVLLLGATLTPIAATPIDSGLVSDSGIQLSKDTAPEVVADTHPIGETEAGHHVAPAIWSVIPFLLLLAMIATGPLFYPKFWHRFYPMFAVALGALVMAYYLFVLHDQHHPVHSMAEYFSFIALIAALYIISGGILIEVDKEGKPLVNVMLLIFGAALANIIGTTGASMLLIRPFIRLNGERIKPYHIVFFIFIVSNVGGSLTPIGDPPLFLGFLKGVPFQWTLIHLWAKWLFGVGLLSAIFYFIDRRNKIGASTGQAYSGKISFKGTRNVFFLLVVIGAVFIDPNVVKRLPSFLYFAYEGDKLSYFREVIMLGAAFLAYKTADKEALKGNDFNFEPIREVGFLFVGIFATMMPALQLIGTFAHDNADLVNVHTLYWATGGLSGVLDNAPTYLNFLSAAMGKMDMDIGQKAEVREFANGVMDGDIKSCMYLVAVSLASVFFGAFTYMGNAPNFMVKSIAEQNGIDMPSFVSYVIKYSIPILFPVLFLTWLVFFVIF